MHKIERIDADTLVIDYNRRGMPTAQNVREARGQDLIDGRDLIVFGVQGRFYDSRPNGRVKLWKTRGNIERPYKVGLRECWTAKAASADAAVFDSNCVVYVAVDA